jgi:Cysteine-rich CPCC/SMI1 / KNR4 family (SUKH-1)
MADLWLVSRSRVKSLTYRETVRLGRVLIDASSKSHVWYPEAPTATVVIREYAGGLSPLASQRLTEVLGHFDAELHESGRPSPPTSRLGGVSGIGRAAGARSGQSGAMNERLASIERELSVPLPTALRSLYETSDGRFGEEGEWWVVWPLDRLVAENKNAWRQGLPTTLIAFGDDGTGNPFCVEVGGTSSEVLRWNWIDLAIERSEGSMDEFIAEWCSLRETRYPCPCCGHLVFHEPPGSDDICPVCYWQDDIVQLRWPDRAGGANRPSLIEAQANFARFGATEQRFSEYTRPPRTDEPMDANWRPFDQNRDFIEPHVSGRDYGDTYDNDRTVYYYWHGRR